MTKRIYQPQISAERIKTRRKELKMTQEQLAKKAHMSVDAVKSYEAGRRVPQEDMRKNLANALGVYEDWIVGGSTKDFSEAMQSFVDALKGIDSLNERLQIYKGFTAFIAGLGYKLDSLGNKVWSVSTADSIKYVDNETINALFDGIINYTCDRFAELENNPSLEKDINTEPDNTFADIFQEDKTYQFWLDNQKEGDAND